MMRWYGESSEPSRDRDAQRELERMLEDEWRTRRRLYPHRPDSDVTGLGTGSSPTGGIPPSPPSGDTDVAAPFEDLS